MNKTSYTQETLFNYKYMENSIVDKSKDVIDSYDTNDKSQFDMYLRILERNKVLIENGLSKSRGYNILTTEEIYNQCKTINFSQSL